MKNKTILFGLTAILIIGTALFGCGSGEDNKIREDHSDEHGDEIHEHSEEEGHIELSPEALKTLNFKTVPAGLRAIGDEIRTTAVIEPDRTRIAHVSPRIAGRVEEVKSFLGESVKKGHVLAEIDSIELGQAKAEYLKAKADYEVARAEYQREDRLFRKEISSEKEYLEAKGNFLRSEAGLNTARETLRLLGLSDGDITGLGWKGKGHTQSHYLLLAPFDGTVIEQHTILGELVTPEDNLYTIVDLSRLWILLDIYEKDLRLIGIGRDVDIDVDSYPGERFRGTVTYISDTLDESTRTAKARVEILNPEKKLKPGMFATAAISLPSRDGKEVIAVPSSSVQRIRGRAAVFVSEGEGAFEMREISPGRESGGFVEVSGGLEPGDEVVTEGGFYLKSVVLKEEMGEGHSH
jgi:cobalt-zinc-cadmium efflux system membrane fusion protein